MLDHSQTKLNTFAEDVRRGLSSMPKFLSSKYFYDDAGSELFRQIMNLPEYYLTRTEAQIFSRRKCEITKAFIAQNKPLDLIELGAGDGTKTAILIDCLLRRKIDFTYSPVDISACALEILTTKFNEEFPNLPVRSRCGDYLQILDALEPDSERAKVIFFLGSNIGNFSIADEISFLKRLRAATGENDLLFIGFDLQKEPQTILRAYDDAQKITAAFNLNLLTRINRELGANFDESKFTHCAEYCSVEGAARSFLRSREKQTVFVKCFKQEFIFDERETVFTEMSRKYTLPMIEQIARQSGFKVVENFLDEKFYFANSLWKTC